MASAATRCDTKGCPNAPTEKVPDAKLPHVVYDLCPSCATGMRALQALPEGSLIDARNIPPLDVSSIDTGYGGSAAHGREKPREETEARLLRERGTPEERIGPVVPDGTLYPQPEPSAATVGPPRVDSPAGIGYIRAMVNTAPRLGARGMGGYGPLTDEWRDTIEKLLRELERRLEVEPRV